MTLQGNPEWIPSERVSKKFGTNIGTLPAWNTTYTIIPRMIDGVASNDIFNVRCSEKDPFGKSELRQNGHFHIS